MNARSTTGSSESRRPTIGRQQELNRLEQWLANPAPETRLFSISGIGGIGKTTLLVEMARRCRQASALTLWLDGQGELFSPGAFLSSIEMSLAHEYGITKPEEEALLPYIVAALSKRRTVLLLDNGEQLNRLEGWLLSSFLPRLRTAGVLLVVASRNGLPAKWLTSPHWSGRIDAFPLQLFTREQSLDYLRESGLGAELQIEVARQSEGHPLLLALTADLLRPREERPQHRHHEIPSMLSADWLREAASPSLHRALTVLALLPAADQSTLNGLLDIPVDMADYYALGDLSFVHSTPQGLSLHHVVARLLREDYMRRDPARFQHMRSKVFALLAGRFHAEDRKTQMRIAAHVLELYREYLPVAHAYADFSSSIRSGESAAYRTDDLQYLHRLLADSLAVSNWHSELVLAEHCHDVLDEIAVHSPECICVVRGEGGTPIAFCAGFRLHAQAAPLLERYAPSFLPMLGEEELLLRQLSSEAADTLCVLLAAVDIRQPLYRPEELGALLMQQWLIQMTSGWRGIMASADAQLNGLFAIMGFREKARTYVQTAHGQTEMTVWELDFRHTSFQEWVKLVIRQTDPGTPPGPAASLDVLGAASRPEAADTAHAGGGRLGASDGAIRDVRGGGRLTANDAKRLLSCWADTAALERLAAELRLPLPGSGVQARLLAVLNAEAATPPLTRLEQQMLREIYWSKDKNKNQLAEAFHMSRTTFYRHSRQAEEHLALVLSRELAQRQDVLGE